MESLEYHFEAEGPPMHLKGLHLRPLHELVRYVRDICAAHPGIRIFLDVGPHRDTVFPRQDEESLDRHDAESLFALMPIAAAYKEGDALHFIVGGPVDQVPTVAAQVEQDVRAMVAEWRDGKYGLYITREEEMFS